MIHVFALRPSEACATCQATRDCASSSVAQMNYVLPQMRVVVALLLVFRFSPTFHQQRSINHQPTIEHTNQADNFWFTANKCNYGGGSGNGSNILVFSSFSHIDFYTQMRHFDWGIDVFCTKDFFIKHIFNTYKTKNKKKILLSKMSSLLRRKGSKYCIKN